MAPLIEEWEEEINEHLQLGWKIRSCGFTELYVFAILEKVV
jgi:hypothetical protein